MKRLKLNSITHNVLRMGGVLVLLLSLLFSCSDDQTVMHTVTFNLDGGSFQDETEMTSTVRDGSTVAKPADPIKDSTETTDYEFNGWYSNAECTVPFEFSTPITEDITIYAKWDNKSNSSNPTTPTTRYTITYTAGTENPESFPSEEKVPAGSTLTKPEDPVLKKDDTNTYVFLGWYNGGNLFDFSTPITQNITLEAKWSESYFNDTGYTVFDEAGLLAWANAVECGKRTISCTLADDITLQDVADGESNWTPISTYSGTFDGNDHTISKMTITEATSGNVGFIAQLSGTVENLGLTGVNINIKVEGTDANVGAIAGFSEAGQIINCYSSGEISAEASGTGTFGTGTFTYVGGIVGNARGTETITACYSNAKISATNSDGFDAYAGGIIGMNGTSSINACYFTGSVSAESTGNSYDAYAGGIIGRNDSTKPITACYSTGSVSAEATTNNNAYAGGIIGRDGTSSSITACYWSAKDETPKTGIGNNMEETDTTDVTNENWENGWGKAMTDMNNHTGTDYLYVQNTDPSTKNDKPFIIQPKAMIET